jgi:hypothetical protein
MASGSQANTRARPALLRPPARNIPTSTRLFLYVRAGGRCQFDGCNRYLLEHHLTKTEGNFAQVAHICAFSDLGPRGGDQRVRDAGIHEASNLILLCPECHKLVDDHPERFTAELLRQQKKNHEDRVYMLTETKPDRHTVALVLMAKIGNKTVSVSLPDVQQAVAPRYLGPRDLVTLDLTAFRDRPAREYWSIAATEIDSKTRALYEQSFEHGPARHISVFALGPIPLLVHLGTRLSDKVPMTLYQRHRNSEGWRWKESGQVAAYAFRTLRHGSADAAVALLLSLSGRVCVDELAAALDHRAAVYEITLSNMEPTPSFLEREESLHAFRSAFLAAMRRIVSGHPGLGRLHLFPAVPAPLAVAVGRDLMTKRDPAVLVYDYDKRAGGFVPALEVNRDEPE